MKRSFRSNGNLNELKLPLNRIELMKNVNDMKQLDTDINMLNVDLKLVKKKGKQLILDRTSTNDTVGLDFVRQELTDLNEKFLNLSQLHLDLKEKLSTFLFNFNVFEQNFFNLDHNLEQKSQMLNILSMGSAAELICLKMI